MSSIFGWFTHFLMRRLEWLMAILAYDDVPADRAAIRTYIQPKIDNSLET